MPGEPTTIDLDWTRMQGTVLEGGYQLEAILAAEEREATFKVRVLGDSAANAIARLFVAPSGEAQEQAATWERTRALDSKHLSIPLGAGLTQLDGATLVYAVLRRPDETLDTAVQERSLSKEEASEVLLAMLRGLEELHSHGLVHGCLSPERILAIGDAIKLSTESVRSVDAAPLELAAARYKAPETAGANVTPAADIWCMGATLVEILTQQRCGDNCIELTAKLPQPFDTIARRCLDGDPAARITTNQAEALLRGRVAAAPMDVKTPARPVVSEHAPAALPPRPPVTRPTQQAQPPKLRAWWMYAAAGIIVVLGLIWLLGPKHTAQKGKQVAAQNTAPAQGSAWVSKTITPEDGKTVAHPQPAETKPAAAAHSSDLVKGPVWRVVLYTYARETDAANKARSVNTKYPGLGAEAFSPSGGSPYLVVVGGQMSRDDAARLRQKVRTLGLPRDAYIQNYQR